jgi:hypothetical protein
MPNLASMAKYNLLPTPQAFDSANMTETIGENDKVELVGNTFRKVTPKGDFGLGLGRLATFGMLPMPDNLPTPSARDWKGKTNPGVVKSGSGCIYGETLPDTIDRLTKQSQGVDAGKTSRLSPLFTEEMMGFPLMWTALPFLSESGAPKPSKPTATPSSPK